MIGLQIKDGIVINAALFDKIPKSWVAAPEGVGIGWIDNGDGTFSAPIVETKLLTQEDYSDAIQKMLDIKAVELGYDNIFTAVTYADEPGVPKFQSEGKALRKWRSLVWEYAYNTLGQVEQGIIEAPTIEDFIIGMPNYE